MPKQIKVDGYIAERIFNAPLLLEENKARVIANYLETRMFGDFTIDAFGDDDRKKREPYQVVGGVGILPIHGTLVHRAGGMDALSGITSYESLRNDLIQAAEDPAVKTILLDIDSGGGEVQGNFELARLIREIHNDFKPVVGIANGSAFSGAYSLGVSAGSLFVTETGGVGSVGVIIQHVDVSKMNQMKGIVITNIVAGDRKAELSPNMPLSDSGRKTLQAEVNRIGDLFVSLVADMRGISENVVKGTQAALLFGSESVNIGFVDGVISFDQLLETLIEINNNPIIDSKTGRTNFAQMKQGIMDMNFLNKKKAEAKIEETVVDPAAPVEADPAVTEAPAEDEPAATEAPKEEAKAEADPVENAAAIVDVCAEASMAHLAAGFIRAGTPLEDVKASVGFKKEVMKVCKLAGKPELADGYAKSGKTLQMIQDDLITKLANSEKDISTTPDPDAVKKDLTSAKNIVMADVERRNKLNQTKKGV